MPSLSLTFYILLAVLHLFLSSTSNEKAPNGSHFSILHIAIGKDNFQTLQDKLGPTKKCHVKDHDGVDIAGYAGPNEALVFEFGEIGGGDITAFSLGSPSRTVGCQLSPLSPGHSRLTTNGGVHLGMTEREFTSLFGGPVTRSRSGEWKYDWTLEARYTEEEKKAAAAAGHALPADTYLVGIIVEARFVKGALQYFYISRLETT